MEQEKSPVRNGPVMMGLADVIFFSRWFQAPLYLGLMIAMGVYVLHYMIGLWHLVNKATIISENDIIIAVLGLIDIVFIANLLTMVIIGGYQTFVSRLNKDNHYDCPEWLGHVNSSMLKIKLSTALIGISSVHLLKTFIEIEEFTSKALIGQVGIHLTFVVSAIALAYIDKLMHEVSKKGHQGVPKKGMTEVNSNIE